MNTRMQRLVILLCAVALVIPLGAIGVSNFWGGDDSEPEPAPTGTVAPADQPEPSPTVSPEPPAPLDQRTGESAAATLVHLLESYGYMMATGETATWEQHSGEGCDTCHAFVQQALLLHGNGGYQVGGEIAASQAAQETTGDPAESAHVEVRIAQDGGQLVDNPTFEPQTFGPTAGIVAADLTWAGDHWVIDSLTVQEDSAGSEAEGTAPGTGE